MNASEKLYKNENGNDSSELIDVGLLLFLYNQVQCERSLLDFRQMIRYKIKKKFESRRSFNDAKLAYGLIIILVKIVDVILKSSRSLKT